MKKAIIVLIIIILVGAGAYFLTRGSSDTVIVTPEQEEPTDVETDTDIDDEQAENREGVVTIGTSVEGRDILAYRYGTGETELLFVGGIHGGYSWNTTLVAYELIDYLEKNSDSVPESVRVSVVPVLNPDGLLETVGSAERFDVSAVPGSQDDTVSGRFNANDVDLNRNFDCDWQPEGVWQNTPVNAGSEAFSEPESKAIRSYINETNPDAVVIWYSAAGGVFASSCHNGILDETLTLTNTYADASGYTAFEEYDFYEITGDMANWLANEEIPAISVLLTTHTDVEWNKNKAGVEALFTLYAE